MKKLTTLILTALMLIGCFCVTAFADDEISVTLRIEGAKNCIYNKTVSTSKTNLTEFLKEVDEAEDTLSITMIETGYGNYISAINTETEKSPYDGCGWGFQVNGEAAAMGSDYVTLKNNDEVTFYFYDYTKEFQFPQADITNINDGIITFTSEDTVYDMVDYTVSIVTNPVKNMTVTWYYGDNQSVEYVTDENGQIKIDSKYLTKGQHKVQVSKYDSDNKVSLVLRYGQDYTVEVTRDVASGDAMPLLLVAAFLSAAVVVSGYKLKTNEK